MTHPTLALPIRTERLILRDFTLHDWEAVHAYGGRDDVTRFMPWGPNDEAASKDFIERAVEAQGASPREKYDLAIVEQASGRLVGGCRIYIKSWQNLDGFLGYVLHADVWGQGYATEAARGLMDAAFTELGLHRIWSTCDDENLASARVMEKLGWQQEGLLRQDVNLRGQWRDSRVLAILRHEWEAGRSA